MGFISKIEFTGTPVTDVGRARAFYEGVLGLQPTREALGGALVEYHLGAGIFTIACLGADFKPSAHGTFVAFEVEDLDDALERLVAHGVQATSAIIELPTSRFAMVSDPDGNQLMLHEARPA